MIALLLQAAPSAPLPMPQTYGEGFLIFALITLGGAFYRSQEARIKREQERCDACQAELRTSTSVISDLTTAFRDLKAVVVGEGRG